MKKILSFLSYHNAVPLAAVVLTMGAGITFAATNPEVILSAQEKVVAIDNTYIAGLDLDSYTPQARVTAVTEDTDAYYVAYSFSTVALQDSVWQNITKNDVLTVSKRELSPSRDLGIYVTEQLKEKIDQEIAYLKKVQEFESKSVTQKQVATAYGGLIGKLLDDKTETLPGYTPLVDAPELQVEPATVATESEPQAILPVQTAPAETPVIVTPTAEEATTNADTGDSATSTDATASDMANIATSTPVTTGDATSTDSWSMATTTPANENETETTQSTDSGSNPNQNPDDSSATMASTSSVTEAETDTTQTTDTGITGVQTQEPAPAEEN